MEQDRRFTEEPVNSVDSVNSVYGGASPWEPPIPFHEYPIVEFPVHALPKWLRDYVEAVSESTQTPMDLAGVLGLCACSSAVARKVVARVRDDYEEPLNVYSVVVLPPAERKSQVFAKMVEPILEYEEVLAQEAGPAIAEAENAYKIKEAELAEARKIAAKAKPTQDKRSLENRARTLALELAAMSVPKPPRLLADDVTPEKLSIMLAEQGGRMAVMSAEGGIFDIIAGRYSSNNSPNLDVFLKGHAGDTLKVDRVGRNSEHVKKPALTLGLTVQPEVIQGVLQQSILRGRGLLARIMYSYPKSKVGSRNVDPPAVPAAIAQVYKDYLTKLLQLRPDLDLEQNPTPHVLLMSEQARAKRTEYAAEIEPKLGDLGEFAAMRDWAGKLVGLVVRLAGILHLAAHTDQPEPWRSPITLEEWEAALALGRYFTAHALAAFGRMGANAKVEQAKLILAWGKKSEYQDFTRRDLWQSLRNRFDRNEDLDPPLDLLVEYRYLQKKPQPDRPGPGQKPSPAFIFNPHLAAQNTQNTQNSGVGGNSVYSVDSVYGGEGQNFASPTSGLRAGGGADLA